MSLRHRRRFIVTPNEKAQLRSQLGFLDGSNANGDPGLLFFEGLPVFTD